MTIITRKNKRVMKEVLESNYASLASMFDMWNSKSEEEKATEYAQSRKCELCRWIGCVSMENRDCHVLKIISDEDYGRYADSISAMYHVLKYGY